MFKHNSRILVALCALIGFSPFVASPARADSATVAAGKSVTFSVSADGASPFTYQWYKDGAALSGATAATYVIASAQTSSSGAYSVQVANSLGSVRSDNGTLTVTAGVTAPTFTLQPLGLSVNVGGSVTFTSSATGSPTPTYQWYFNGSAIAGATSSNYTISNVLAALAGSYKVVATNSAGSATSNTAVLTVNLLSSAPSFTTQPVSKTVTVGSSVTFTAAASGTPSPTYQWRKNGSNISGATSSSYTISNVQTSSAGTYTVVASNSAGSATSSGATLTVSTATSAPVITSQPVSLAVAQGAAATFAVAATGNPAPTYQWRKNGSNISGATSSSYTIASVSSGSAGTYSVVVKNSAGSVTSSGATLTIKSSIPPSVARCDFNHDGQTDILWQNTSTLEASVWFMSGTTLASSKSFGTPSANWQVAGAGDFNGDGLTDIVWQNSSSGDRYIWFMSNGSVIGGADVGVVSTDWQIVGTGDFNNDGQCDLLWQNNATGDRYIWLMNGVTAIGSVDLGIVSTDWQVTGTGDMNGDGQCDILWQNSKTGDCYVWVMNGTKQASGVDLGTVPSGWQMSGAGDFNGNGQCDIIFQNVQTGQVKVWLMSGTSYLSTVVLGTVTTNFVIRN